jgi:hypothetical protein
MVVWLNPRIDRALKAQLVDCRFTTVGIAFSPRRLTSRYGTGVWVAILGAG